MLYVTLADVKAHLNITSSAQDDELSDIADAAEAAVVNLAGPVTGGATTVTVGAYRGVAILPSAPVAAVTSVTSGGGAVAFTADLAAGLVYVAGDWAVTVTYTATAVPDLALMRVAVLMVTARLWETQRGNTPTILQGGEEPTFTPGVGGILTEVRALLGIGDQRPSVA